MTRDGSTSSPVVDTPSLQDPTPWTPASSTGVAFSGLAFKDLAGSADGRRIFAWIRPATLHEIPGLGMSIPQPTGVGAQVALDSERFVELDRLALAEVLSRDRCDPAALRFTRHSPRGDALWVVVGSSAQQYMFGGERHGENIDVAHCNSAGHFSDAAYEGASGDSLLVANGQEVQTRHAHTEWLGVHATHALFDAERIAAVGPRELAVYDRQRDAEQFRVKVGESWQVALLPERRTAVISGPFGKKQLRVFDWEGGEMAVYRMANASAMQAAPSGLLAVLSGSYLQLVDLTAAQVVTVTDGISEFAWLGDDRIAVVRADRLGVAVVDVKHALSAGKPKALDRPRAKKPKAPTG
jgi:hypothetical protein